MEHNLNFQNMPCTSSGINIKLVKCFAYNVQVQKKEAFKAWTISKTQDLSFFIGLCQNFFEYLALIYSKVFEKERCFYNVFCCAC